MNNSTSHDVGEEFTDHGVATPVSNHRGTVATADGEGRNVVLVWLFDHRGGYALLVLDADTGRHQEIPMPFEVKGNCPFSSILSSKNRFYTHFDDHFTEFDTAKRAFTFTHRTRPGMAMGMTEDDLGRIWAVTYPNSGVVCFDPDSKKLKDYGYVHHENWMQYQRFVAADDTGWIYFAVGNTASQIVALDPESGSATPLLPEEKRKTGSAYVYRDLNGKVYGQALHGETDGWYELYRGQAAPIDQIGDRQPKPIITASQSLFHDRFPDGRRLVRCDLLERVLAVENPDTGKTEEHSFDYSSEGAHIMGLAAAPNGTICGGTAFPMRFFSYRPETGSWENQRAYCQFNTMARQGEKFFFGGYTHGFLLEWDPAQPWRDTEKNNAESNPRFIVECEPDINRPHVLLAHPDGVTLIMGGTPGYGYTGGGLLFYNRSTGENNPLKHNEILPEHSTMSLAPLPGRKLLGGSTTDPGTGGERKATVAELYIMDMNTGNVEWHEPVLNEVQGYIELCAATENVVYGIADAKRFFAFDTATRTILHEQDTADEFGRVNYQQGQRKFVRGPDGAIYVLFQRVIARVDNTTHRLVGAMESPVTIQFGGDILNGRIYFASSSHLYSCRLPEKL